jgi:hypothetical protein
MKPSRTHLVPAVVTPSKQSDPPEDPVGELQTKSERVIPVEPEEIAAVAKESELWLN